MVNWGEMQAGHVGIVCGGNPKMVMRGAACYQGKSGYIPRHLSCLEWCRNQKREGWPPTTFGRRLF